MLQNSFKNAWRSIRMHKAYAAINIAGLAVGIAASLLIFIVIRYETTYDRFEKNSKRIYRTVAQYINPVTGEVKWSTGSVTPLLSKAIHNDLHEIEAVAPVWYIGGAQIHIPIPGKDLADERRVKQNDGLFFTEPALFSMFDYHWLAGNAARLNEPNTCVLNETLANTFFGDWQKAIGQTIQMWSFRVPLQVTGIFKDLPAHTEMEIKMGASFSTFRKINTYMFEHEDWAAAPWPSQCFVLLQNNTSADQINFQSIVNKYYPPEKDSKEKVQLSLQPLANIHLSTEYNTYKSNALTQKELWSLALTAFFLLLVACINFVNLATAQSVNRAKEIGVRKVLGSSRPQILRQFLGETAVMTTIAVLLALLLVQLALPFTSQLMGKPLALDLLKQPVMVLFIFGLGLAVNFLAGFYPGIVLAGFNPVEAIKSKLANGNKGISLRRGLVVFQFVIAQLLIIGTIVVLQQMRFFRNQPMGFDKNAVAFIELPSDSTDQMQYPYLKQQMLQTPGIEAACFAMDAPASFGSNNNNFFYDGNPVRKDFSVNLQFGDTGYLQTFRIGLMAGRLPYESDTMRELLVNETMVKKLGTTNQAVIGKVVSFDGTNTYPIVGVMHDFNSKSLKEPVAPFALTTHRRAYSFIALRIDPLKMAATLPRMEKLFTQTYPTYIYDLSFLDERITHFYNSEAMAATLFQIAAFFSIFISCLGLYGLVSFMALRKTKEVGIRKVLGASVQSIVMLFSREFINLIGISFLIAAPLGYLFMQEWLNGFHYHIELSWLVFAAAILVSGIISLFTVGYKAIQAATADPVKSIKTE